MKRKSCKLDDKSMLTVELEKTDGKTFMTIIDRCHTHEQTGYQGFANVCSHVDNYRLLQLADYIYEYCQSK